MEQHVVTRQRGAFRPDNVYLCFFIVHSACVRVYVYIYTISLVFKTRSKDFRGKRRIQRIHWSERENASLEKYFTQWAENGFQTHYCRGNVLEIDNISFHLSLTEDTVRTLSKTFCARRLVETQTFQLQHCVSSNVLFNKVWTVERNVFGDEIAIWPDLLAFGNVRVF